MAKNVLVIDLISHSEMHLPFNEGFLAFLSKHHHDSQLTFCACEGHINNLVIRRENLAFRSIPNLREALGSHSIHDPFKTIPLTKCIISQALNAESYDMVYICGAYGPMIYAISRVLSRIPTRIVQHDQLATAMAWQPRNPLIKLFSYPSALKWFLSKRHQMIMLELGLTSVIRQISARAAQQTVTLEHPILTTEHQYKPFDHTNPKFGFLGHCDPSKGFDIFCAMSVEFQASSFVAIGKDNYLKHGDIAHHLAVPPTESHLSREEFLARLHSVDIILLPLKGNTSYVSSGSIIDAIASLKPMIIRRNQSIAAIAKKYGEFCFTYLDEAEIPSIMAQIISGEKQHEIDSFIAVMSEIRRARAPENLQFEVDNYS